MVSDYVNKRLEAIERDTHYGKVRAGFAKRVRRGTHRENCQLSWPEFRANDSEANNLPEVERRRGQEPVCKAGSS